MTLLRQEAAVVVEEAADLAAGLALPVEADPGEPAAPAT
jgi:hypothetical protein